MDIIIVGFALFSLFFGAGNLIFPPFLGKIYGSTWLVASFGFILTGAGLACISVISMAKRKGNVKEFTNLAGNKLGSLTIILIAMTLGPLGGIPRTGATSAEVMIEAGLPIPYIFFIIAFFAVTLILILTDSKIIDIIGKYLTPALLIVLAVMIIAGIINPIGEINTINITQGEVFNKSLIEGYNTMDALAAIAFTPIIIKSLLEKGYEENLIKKTIAVTLIAACGLILVYISLTYLGSTSSIRFNYMTSRVALLIAISNAILGSFGKYILAAIIVLACFTTSVGLTSSIADMLYKTFDRKISYKLIAVFITIISVILSLVGVDRIIEFTSPLLTFAYPVVLVMIIYNIFEINFTNRFRIISFYLVAIISLCQSMISYVSMAKPELADEISKVISWLPMYRLGFPWLIPFIIILAMGLLFARKDEKVYALA